jgi:hypothetical protein
MDTVTAKDTPEAVRQRARTVLLLAVEKIQDRLESANEHTLNELAGVTSSLGRISGVQQDDAKVGDVTIRIIRDALPDQHTYSSVATPLPTDVSVPMLNSGNGLGYAERVEAMAHADREADNPLGA